MLPEQETNVFLIVRKTKLAKAKLPETFSEPSGSLESVLISGFRKSGRRIFDEVILLYQRLAPSEPLEGRFMFQFFPVPFPTKEARHPV